MFVRNAASARLSAPLFSTILLLSLPVGCHRAPPQLGEAQAPDPAGLFEPLATEAARPELQGLIRVRDVEVRLDRLGTALSPVPGHSSASGLRLNLFADAVFDVALSRLRRVGDNVVWEGTVIGTDASSVRLIERDGVLAGTVRADRRLFTLTPHLGRIQIREWDESAVPEDAAAPVPSGGDSASGAAAKPRPTAQDGSSSDERRLDVLVVYTSATLEGAGSLAALTATVELAVAEANASFEDSSVDAHVELVGLELTDYDETDFQFGTALSRVQMESDGFMDDVPARRDELGADHVVMIVESAGPWAGIGYQLTGENAPFFAGAAYSVVARAYAAGHYTFAHELGHNLGAHHDEENANDAYRADSRGHRDQARGFRTIMAYSCEGVYCGRVGRWSNPDVQYGGGPTGQASMSDNARTLNETVLIASQFRTRPTLPPPVIPPVVPPAEAAHIVEPADTSTLDAGVVTFRWTDVGADEHRISVGRHPGDTSILDAVIDTGFSHVAELPQDGSTLHVRLWSRHLEDWLFVDHTFVAHTDPVFEGAQVSYPSPSTTLRSTWSWFAWARVEGAREYYLQVTAGTEVVFERFVGRQHYARVGGLPTDGRVVFANLWTNGPDGWVVHQTRFTAWSAPDYGAVITSPRNGAQLTGPTATFRWTRTDSEATWLIVRDSQRVLFASRVEGESVEVGSLPTDGRELIVALYSLGPEGWVATAVAIRAATR